MKPFLTVCCAAIALPATAQTVQLYGLVDATVRHERIETSRGSAKRMALDEGSFNGSRWGVRGTEELGGGLKAGFILEAGFDASSGAILNSTATRDNGIEAAPAGRAFGRLATVSLSAPWGSLSLGRQYTLAHSLSDKFQPHGNPNLAALAVFPSHHLSRQDNMLIATVGAGAVTGYVSHTFGEETISSRANSSQGIAASYETSQVYVAAYAQNIRNLANREEREIRGAGASWAVLPSTRLFAGVMTRDQRLSLQENRVWTVGVRYQFAPAWLISASHTADRQTGSLALAGNRKVSYLALTHALSKRTDVYGEIDRNTISGAYPRLTGMAAPGHQTGMAVGIRHRF